MRSAPFFAVSLIAIVSMRWLLHHPGAEAPMASNFVLVAALYIHPGREAEFERFETAAAAIMKRHGGAIERHIRCTAQADKAQPYEVHIVTFPDEPAFERYRTDPALAALSELRASAIRQTSVWTGIDVAPLRG